MQARITNCEAEYFVKKEVIAALETSKSNLEVEVQQMQQQYEEKINVSKLIYETKLKEINDLEKSKVNIHSKIQELVTREEEILKRNNDLEADLRSKMLSVQSKEFDHRVTLQKLAKEVSGIEEKYKLIKEKLDRAEQEYTQVTDRIKQTQSQLIDKRVELDEIKKSLKNYHNQEPKESKKETNQQDKLKQLDILEQEKEVLEVNIEATEVQSREVTAEPFEVICEDKTLMIVEKELEDILKKVKLIGQITLNQSNYTYLGEKISESIRTLGYTSVRIRYPNCIVVFMVFTATYCYDGQYWEYIEKYFGDVERERLMDVFHKLIHHFQLDKFQYDKNTFKNVTPILFQAMVPNYSIESVVKFVEEEFIQNCTAAEELYRLRDTFEYRLDKPVQRYIEYLEKDWTTFFREVYQVMNGERTEGYQTLSKQMVLAIADYYKKGSTKQSTAKSRLSIPKLCIDVDGIGIYFALPEQKFYEETIEEVYWCMDYPYEEKKKIEPELHYKNGEYFIKAMNVPIGMTDEVTVELEVNGQKYKRWCFKGLKNPYVAFNTLGIWEGQDIVTSGACTLLWHKDYVLLDEDIIVEEVEPFSLWKDYKVYHIDLKEKAYISYLTLSGETKQILIKNISQPHLSRGRVLFDEFIETSEEVKSYVELPELYINEIISKEEEPLVKITIKKANEEQAKQVDLTQISRQIVKGATSIRIKLEHDSLIRKNHYGEYELTVHRAKKILNKFRFNYVPQVEVRGHLNKHAYIYNFKLKSGVKINFEEGRVLEEKYSIYRGGTQTWEFQTAKQYAEGTLECKDLSNKNIQIRVAKQIRSIAWGMVDFETPAEIKWSDRPFNLSLEELGQSQQVYLLIEGEHIYRSNQINIVLQDQAQNTLKYIDGVKRKNKSHKIKINLSEYIEVLKKLESDAYELKINIDCQGEKIQYTLVRFAKKIRIEKLTQREDTQFITLEWDQEGKCANQEIVLYPLEYIWEAPLIHPVSEGESHIKMNKKELYTGKYALELRYQKDEWSFEEDDDKQVWTIDGLKKIKLKGEKNFELEVPLHKELHGILSKQTFIDTSIHKGSKVTEDDYQLILKTLLTVDKNTHTYDKETITPMILKQYEEVIGKNLQSYITYLLEADLTPSQFKQYCTWFNLQHVVGEGNIELTPWQIQKLWMLYPLLAYQVTLQDRSLNREEAVECLMSYIGEQGLHNFINKRLDEEDCEAGESLDGESHDFKACMKYVLWGDCYCEKVKTTLESDLLGNHEDVINYYMKLSEAFDSGGRYRNRKSFTKDASKQVRKDIFLNKSYVEIIAQMRKDLNHMERTARQIHTLLNPRLPYIKEVMSKGRHKHIHTLLEKRKDTEQQFGYWCGIGAYLLVCEKRKIETGILTPHLVKELTKLLVEETEDLYERDTVLFDLYYAVEG